MSEAYFENFIGAIDTILICILKPTSQQSRDVSICEGKLKSHQKYKYRFNIQSREGGEISNYLQLFTHFTIPQKYLYT